MKDGQTKRNKFRVWGVTAKEIFRQTSKQKDSIKEQVPEDNGEIVSALTAFSDCDDIGEERGRPNKYRVSRT